MDKGLTVNNKSTLLCEDSQKRRNKEGKKKEILRGIAAQLNEIYHTQMFQADNLPQLATLATTKHM